MQVLVKHTILIHLFFVLVLMCRAFDIHGQADVVMLTDPKKPQSLQKVSFRFAPGDNPKWANPLFPDSSWQVVSNTAFGTDQYSDAALPEGWARIGWFRIWLKKTSDSLGTVRC